MHFHPGSAKANKTHFFQESTIVDRELLRQNKRANQLQTAKLICGMALVLGVLGYAIFSTWGAGWVGAVGALPVALLVAWFGPRVSPKVVLRMFHAEYIQPEQAPQLYSIHHALCERADLEFIPPLFYVPSRMPNAFAVGTGKQAAVAISDGLLHSMTPRELAGILGHEISHIRHDDVKIMSMADSFSRLASSAARGGLILFVLALLGGYWQGLWRLLLLLLAPALTTIIQLALSRSREFNADMGAAELTGDPQGLAMALDKLERMIPQNWFQKMLFPGGKDPQVTALRTHPPTEERVLRLMDLVPQFAGTPYLIDDEDGVLSNELDHEQVARRPRWHIVSGSWH